MARSTFQSQNVKTRQRRSAFVSSDVAKVHAVVVRSTCRSQHVKNTSASDHFWNLRCRKSDVAVARRTCRSQNVKSTSRSDHVWMLRCPKSAWHEWTHLQKSARDCDNLHILHIGPTLAKSTIWPNLGPSWTHLAPISADGVTWPQLGPFGATSAQVEAHIASKWGQSWPNTKSSKRPFSPAFPTFFAVDDASFDAMFPMLCPCWAQLGVKLSPKGPNGCDLDFHVHHMASIWGPVWIALGPISAQHDQLAPTWGSRYCHFAPS